MYIITDLCSMSRKISFMMFRKTEGELESPYGMT